MEAQGVEFLEFQASRKLHSIELCGHGQLKHVGGNTMFSALLSDPIKSLEHEKVGYTTYPV